MKEERILNILGEIDDSYIEEAAEILPCKRTRKDTRKNIRFPAAAAAAAAAVIAAAALFACIRFLPAGTNSPEINTPGTDGFTDPSVNLPPATGPAGTADYAGPSDSPTPDAGLPLLSSRFDTETGMGFEGMMYYDISEAENGNPWTEEQSLNFLPVYRNLAYTDMGGISVFLSEEEMLELAERTAAALDTLVEETTCQRISDITEQPPTGRNGTEAYSLCAKTALGEITVYGNGQVRVFFSEPVTLPEEYRFTYSHTTDEEATDVLRYLTGRYQDLCAFSQTTFCTGGDYTYSGERTRFYQAYDKSGDLTQQILNYHFSRISFSPDDDGKLFIIWFGNLLAGTEKVGDYPLISVETARQLLLNGSYITTVPSEYLGGGTITESQIARTELVYRTGSTEELFMPYYRFYVELTDYNADMADGLRCYGAYYVPAVSGEYLSDFPVWDGQFN